MIPVNAEQKIEHVDKESGMKYIFRPILGEAEIAFCEYLDGVNKMRVDNTQDTAEYARLADKIIDAIVCGWEGGPADAPKYPADGKPSKLFRLKDKAELIAAILSKNELTPDEKVN